MIPQWYIVVSLGLLGAILGSFAGAQVWRLRKRQLHEDKLHGEEYDKKELKQLERIKDGKKGQADRSVCLKCGHTLTWYDLIPILSWLSTAGKCRYCRQSIGWFEPLIELVMALLFVLAYLVWPFGHDTHGLILLGLFYVACVLFAILFSYDTLWFLLPDRVTILLGVVGLVYAGVALSSSHDLAQSLWSLFGALLLMSGLYAALYLYSRQRNGEDKTWIGLGDVKLGVGLGLLLVDWQLAFLALFLANALGLLLIAPFLATGKIGTKTRIPFGPLLIIGTIVSVLFGKAIIAWYLRTVVFGY